MKVRLKSSSDDTVFSIHYLKKDKEIVVISSGNLDYLDVWNLRLPLANANLQESKQYFFKMPNFLEDLDNYKEIFPAKSVQLDGFSRFMTQKSENFIFFCKL